MNNEDLYDGITDIREDLIDVAAARKRPRRRRLWTSAIAAMLALAVLLGVALRPGGGGMSASACAIAEAEYPEMPPRPNEEDFFDPVSGEWDSIRFDKLYDPWFEAQRARWTLPEDYAAGMEDFFASSIRQFLSGGPGENRVYSPVNVCIALSMLAELTDGDSRDQILTLLGQEGLEDLRTQISNIWRANYCNDGATTSILANSLWLNRDVAFVPSTLETLAKDYYASSYQGEMGSEALDQALREWINQQTGGLLEEQAAGLKLDPETVLALASTIYFRARWSNEFQKEQTAPQVFHGPEGDLTCDFMHRSGSDAFFWGEHFSAVSVELDNYGGTMTFLLPDEGITPEELLEDSQAMEFLLMDNKWDGWANIKYLIVNLAMPKFDVSSDLDLISGLQALGITDVFDPTASDFTPMTKEVEEIYVSQAEHAARVAVDEEGVTAAAYTVMAMCESGAPPEEEMDFVLDRPFLFVITGIDGLPLFTGVVNQPA